ncbi:MAG: hypothetical protein ACKVRN_05100 [Pyrinomonadaceae bacterium]
MVNRINPKSYGKPDKITPRNTATAVNYFSETRSQLKQSDDLILSLANALENRRARQVTEWEQMRRQ